MMLLLKAFLRQRQHVLVLVGLVVNKDGKLEVTSSANQDNPLLEGKKAILCLDVWEHAYYLHYQNRRPDYIKEFFRVINWDKVSENYEKALKPHHQ